MPLFYQHTINETTKLGIWHIEEGEDFFLAKVPLQKNITHPHKRLQHLAGRYLLPCLFNDFPYTEILIADTKKPYLPGEQYHFSISHCGDYAAAIVSSTGRVGVDIEIPSEKVERVAHKFLNEVECMHLSIEHSPQSIGENPSTVTRQLLTVLWSAKESLFKWYSLGKVDFRGHIQLCGMIQQKNNSLLLPFVFKKNEPLHINVTARIFDEIVLSWVA
ncbi:4'-phosphopantetheinyl transferase family protein [Parafilimonas sp.]|uniref:4'-phosphopantetheinyl transferase family protein n=1 Tax=Parafilimonas sp. TaxID=1969739 RepID=UPI0039E45B59